MIYLILLFILSVSLNVIFVLYIKKMLRKYYFASEGASQIFTHLDAYREHIKSIFQLEMFYGDRDLKSIFDHTKDMVEFLKKYSEIYSFTQPELEEVLLREDEPEEEEKVDKIYQKREHREEQMLKWNIQDNNKVE